MMWSTHVAGGAVLWLGVSLPLPDEVVWAGMPIAAVGALLPDFDHRQSAAARAFEPVFRKGIVIVRQVLGQRRTGFWAVTRDVVCALLAALAWLAHVISPATYQFTKWVERRFGGHRAGTHSLLVGVPLCGLLAALLGVPVVLYAGGPISTARMWSLLALLAGATSVGALSHILLDSLTNGGVQWLWPWKKRRYGLSLMVVNGWGEHVPLRIALWVLAGVAGVATISGW